MSFTFVEKKREYSLLMANVWNNACMEKISMHWA